MNYENKTINHVIHSINVNVNNETYLQDIRNVVYTVSINNQ